MVSFKIVLSSHVRSTEMPYWSGRYVTFTQAKLETNRLHTYNAGDDLIYDLLTKTKSKRKKKKRREKGRKLNYFMRKLESRLITCYTHRCHPVPLSPTPGEHSSRSHTSRKCIDSYYLSPRHLLCPNLSNITKVSRYQSTMQLPLNFLNCPKMSN